MYHTSAKLTFGGGKKMGNEKLQGRQTFQPGAPNGKHGYRYATVIIIFNLNVVLLP